MDNPDKSSTNQLIAALRKIKKAMLFPALMALAAIAAQAGTTCPTGAYTLYLVANFTCQSDNLIFKNFGYSSSANPAGITIPASGVTVTPITTNQNEGFQFAGGWNVGTQAAGVSSFQDSVVTFDVMMQVPFITDLHLFFNGSLTGTGLTSVAESFCLNHALPGCPGGSSGQINVTNPPPAFNSAVFFAPVQLVSISNEINATSGGNGTASISQVINTISNSPEPATIALMGAGLLGLGLFRKRFARR
jgi:hypothetical protein